MSLVTNRHSPFFDTLVTVIANTASTVLAEALAEEELVALKTELEERRVAAKVDRFEIVEAFRKGKELLMSGEIPHHKQLIKLFVRRIEVFPD